MFDPVNTDVDYPEINRALDRVKSSVFRRPNAAFFGPLMCSLNFVWSTAIDTAGTDGQTMWWNPEFFMTAPDRFNEPKFNEFVIMHELWHVARLHMIRGVGLCPDYFNYACDIRINNDLVEEKFSFGSCPAWFNPGFDQANGSPMAEEDIYDLIFKNPPSGKPMALPQNPWGNGDIIPGPDSQVAAVNNVVKAVQSAKMSGQPGSIPGGVEQVLDRFLSPIIPWETHLKQWMTDLLEFDYTWARPNRRYSDMYLPSNFQDEGRLEHLVYFQDVSGSITDADIMRFNSELKYVWDELKPARMTVVQFDTIIQRVDEFNEGDEFNKIIIVGRGGTSLVCVRDKIIELNPTAAIIFSDMQVLPMQALPVEIPILWVATNAKGCTVPFGKLIHIKT